MYVNPKVGSRAGDSGSHARKFDAFLPKAIILSWISPRHAQLGKAHTKEPIERLITEYPKEQKTWFFHLLICLAW